MKIQKQKNRKRTIALVVIGVILLLAAGGFAWVLNNQSAENAEQITNEKADSQQLEDSATEPTNPKENPPDPKTNDQTTDKVPVNPDTSLHITQLEQQGNEVKLNSSLTNAGSGGTCVATFTNPNGRPVVKEFASEGARGCGPLTVSAIEFSVIGEWELKLRFYNQGRQVVAKQNITIR